MAAASQDKIDSMQ